MPEVRDVKQVSLTEDEVSRFCHMSKGAAFITAWDNDEGFDVFFEDSNTTFSFSYGQLDIINYLALHLRVS